MPYFTQLIALLWLEHFVNTHALLILQYNTPSIIESIAYYSYHISLIIITTP